VFVLLLQLVVIALISHCDLYFANTWNSLSMITFVVFVNNRLQVHIKLYYYADGETLETASLRKID